MTKLINFFRKKGISQDVQEAKLSSLAEGNFKPKTYLQENKSKYLALSWFGGGLQLMGALLALSFFLDIFSSSFPLSIAFALALVVCIGLELLKRVLIMGAFVGYLKGKREFVEWLIIAILQGLSIASSWLGGASVASSIADKSQELAQLHQSKQDSISLIYAKDTASIQEQIRGIEKHKSSRWGGLLTSSENEQLSTLRNDFSSLTSAYQDKLKALELEQQKTLIQNENTMQSSSNWTAWLSLLCELLNLVCLWWCAKFLLLVYLEQSEQEQDTQTAYVNTANVATANVNTASVVSPNIGFKLDKSQGNRTCENCGKEFIYKIHNQRFCKESCRVESWEKRTGKKLNKK